MNDIYYSSFYSMGTRFVFLVPHIDFEKGDRVFNHIKKEVERIELLLSYFKSDSEVYKLNHRIKNNNLPISDELFNIIEICNKYNILTEGMFDITLRPVIEYLQSATDERKLNENSFLETCGMDKVKLSKQERTITFQNDFVKIDFGGFGKGYALGKIMEILYNYYVTDAFISFGESSVLGLGNHPNGNSWSVGIRKYNCICPSNIKIELNNESLSTSSNFTLSDNGSLRKRISVLSPVTKCTVTSLKSISVKSKSPLEAEILSTAFLVTEQDHFTKLSGKFNVNYYIETFFNSARELNIYSEIN